MTLRLPSGSSARRPILGGVVEIKAFEHIVPTVAQLFGHVDMAVPHRGFLQRGGRDLFGRLGRGQQAGGGEQEGKGAGNRVSHESSA
jgi:hypothetical protein